MRGVVHPAENARSALVMVGGAGGGIHGPANSYEELATRLQAEGIVALRLEYRKPNYLAACVYDVLAGIAALDQQGINRVALLGWSFGGAVVISAGAVCDASVGVATVASQTYGTGAVGKLSPKSLLLIHGTADQVLPYYLAENLYARAGEPKELVLYLEDGHGIERHRSEMLEKLYSWSSDLLLINEGADGVQ